MKRRSIFALPLSSLLAALLLPGQPSVANSTGPLASAAKGGHIVLIRHAYAPGTGDPSNFRIGDCSTQRNLDASGRQQARRIGARLRQAFRDPVPVYSSQWCRCLETAGLLGLGPVEELPALNSFYDRPGEEKARMTALRRWLASRSLERPLILVTHQVTITALSGIFPASGEAVVLRRLAPGGWKAVGTVKADR
ncbi:MAG: histidine phosphatase family protein [Beijerinckiaceae bacterium]